MAVNRVPIVDQRFRDSVLAAGGSFHRVPGGPDEPIIAGSPLTRAEAVSLLECQITSRWLDFVARELKAKGQSFYTIGSSGHEGNALVGLLTRHTDPAFLHYRSGGFFLARARQVPGQTPIFDTCLSLTASIQDPISGGRHKVWGSRTLNIPPQTSTIASQLPKAMGAAFFLDRRTVFGTETNLPEDAIIVCSFGDASANHSTALGAINAAACAAYQNLPTPVLFVCEDNGVGISVHTPSKWIEANYRNRAGLAYFQADGLDIAAGYANVAKAIDYCRTRRRPVFLHLKTIRMMGHAGSDVEVNYRTKEEIEAVEAHDPVLKSALRLIEAGVLSAEEVIAMYDQIAEQVRAAGREAAQRPKQSSPAEIRKPLFPDYRKTSPLAAVDPKARRRFWRENPPETQKPRHMAQLINWALRDLLYRQKEIAIFGEDIAKKGGVYHVTTDLFETFGKARVFNTILDEQSILGLAIGAGHLDILPIPEIQYLAYLHNAIDQLRGEACSLQYFSEGRFRNPMVVRIAGFAYQKGFGGHFHNDNAFAAIREIPGIVMVTASNGADAVRLLRTSVAIARDHGAVVVFIEPIALYMVKDLVDKGDWCCAYPEPDEVMPFGEIGYYGDADAEILVISYANGTYLSLQARDQLKKEGVATQLMDLRFLTPLNKPALIAAARGKKEVIIVDECRQTGSLSEEIATALQEGLQPQTPHITRVTGDDTYIPLGNAWEMVLPSKNSIYQAIKERSAHG